MSDQKVNYVISSRDPMMIETFEGAIAEIECSLSNLRRLAIATNFEDPAERQNYKDNISYLKRFYECAERNLLK